MGSPTLHTRIFRFRLRGQGSAATEIALRGEELLKLGHGVAAAGAFDIELRDGNEPFFGKQGTPHGGVRDPHRWDLGECVLRERLQGGARCRVVTVEASARRGWWSRRSESGHESVESCTEGGV